MSDNPENCSNYLRIIRMLVDLGTKTARDIFYHKKPRDRVSTFFGSTTICNEIFHLKRNHVITPEQYNKIMSDPNPDEFDLSLLVTLLTNIFVGMIDPPPTGWDRAVNKHDLSLGADLLRLKQFRNTLIGHSLEAKITSEEFEKLWGQAEQVLLRLNQHIDVTHVNDMKISLEEYKGSRLDPENEDEKKYVGILQHWCEEGALTLSSIKNEVDKLWERTKEFECFFEDVPECYSRYAILLYEGGSLVLNAVLRREEGRGTKDLKTLLLENSHTLKGDIPNIEDLLSHDKGKLNLTSWDIPSVCSVLLRLFEDRLSFLEKDAIRTIKSARENYADIALASLDGGKFATYWADLKSSLYTLSSGQEEMIQIQCKGLVDRYGKEPLDKNAANKFLGQLGEGSGQLKRLLEAYKETSTRLEEVVEEMDRKGIPFKGDRVMHIKMITRGNTEERREVAEEILFTVWQKALDASDNSEEFPNVKKAVKNILDVIHGMDHVKLMDVTKHCVILTFGCSTSAGLLSLITFFNGHAFKELMTDIDRALTEEDNGDIHVTGYITFESMSLISKHISTDDSEAKYVSLPIVCDSVKGIKNVKRLFDDGHLSNYENQMSQALSQQTGGIISLTTELDLKGLNHLLRTFENSTDDADSNESTPRATADMSCKPQEPDTEEKKIHTEPEEKNRTRNIFQILERKTVVNVYGMRYVGKTHMINKVYMQMQQSKDLCIFIDFEDVQIQSPAVQYKLFHNAFKHFNENAGTKYFKSCFPEKILMCGICNNCKEGLDVFTKKGFTCLKKTLTLTKAFNALTLCMKIYDKNMTVFLDSTDQFVDCISFANFLKSTSRLCSNVKIVFVSRKSLDLDFDSFGKLEITPLCRETISSLLYSITESCGNKRHDGCSQECVSYSPEKKIFTPENREEIEILVDLCDGLPVAARFAGKLLTDYSVTPKELIRILESARLRSLSGESSQNTDFDDNTYEPLEPFEHVEMITKVYREFFMYMEKNIPAQPVYETHRAVSTGSDFTNNIGNNVQTSLHGFPRTVPRSILHTGQARSDPAQKTGDAVSTTINKRRQYITTESVIKDDLNETEDQTQPILTSSKDMRNRQIPSKKHEEHASLPPMGVTQRNLKRFGRRNIGKVKAKTLKQRLKSKLRIFLVLIK